MTDRDWALVTGASEGIGREMALDLASRGWNVLVTARSADRLEALAEELRAMGAQAETLPLDLAEEGATQALWDWAMEKAGNLDMLVNNAGFGAYGPMAETDWPRERGSLRVNIEALTHLSKQAARHMAARGRGRILNVASTAAFQPLPHMAVYGATKAYVVSFSEALAEELAGTGVTVTTLCPGATETGFQTAAEMQDARIVKQGGMATAKDVASYGVRAALRGGRVRVHGLANTLLSLAPRFLPGWVVTKLAKVTMERS